MSSYGRLPVNSRSSELTYEGDITPPVVSYASSFRNSPMFTTLNVPASTASTNSAVVDRKPIRKGIRYFYSHGGVDMPTPGMNPARGGVASSEFQTVLVQLQDWVINVGWRMAGYPRNLGLSFRGPQPHTQVTGGSGPGRMQQRPLFPGVQVVPRYAASVRRYPTKASRS